jgi:hypothetical protein
MLQRVEILIKEGADVMAKNIYEYTALKYDKKKNKAMMILSKY